jgi:hypothetical protein
MASAGTSVSADELIVATLDKQGKGAVDNVFVKVPAVEFFRQNGKVDYDGSGVTYRQAIKVSKNTSVGWTSGYKTLTTTPVSTIKEVLYQLKRCYASVTYSQDMKDINRGNAAVIKLVDDKISEAKDAIAEQISASLQASSVATDAIDSLQTTIDSTGAVGGLNQSSESAWASYEASCGSFAAGGIEAMQLAFNTVSKGRLSGNPGLIITTQTVYQYLQSALRAYGMDYFASRGDLGVEELKFMGAKVIWDPNALSGTMLFINPKGIGMAIDGQANMVATEFNKPIDQLAYTGQIYIRTQLICSERRAQGKLTGITA